VLKDVMLPVIPKVPPQDKRLVLVGLTRTLFRGQATASLANNEPWYVQCAANIQTLTNIRPLTFTTLLQAFGSQASNTQVDEDPDAGITSIDYEEQTAGYQVAYSKLAASEVAKPDPVAYAGDARQYLITELANAVQRTGGSVWATLIQRSASPARDAFLQEYTSAGHSF
jgi:exportin-2 (importin alpha re-exporter)